VCREHELRKQEIAKFAEREKSEKVKETLFSVGACPAKRKQVAQEKTICVRKYDADGVSIANSG